MRVLETMVEPLGGALIRVTSVIDTGPVESMVAFDSLGEGPTGSAVPDRIVRCLIDRESYTATLAELHAEVGGNPATVNRQAWTLATNAPDLQKRLRGWVRTVARGVYELSPEAKARIAV